LNQENETENAKTHYNHNHDLDILAKGKLWRVATMESDEMYMQDGR
jgi:hypothetical protein